MKKIISAVLLVWALMPMGVGAEDRLPITVTVYSKLLSQYLVNTGNILYDKPVSQSGLTLGWGEGYSVDVWRSYPLDGKDGAGKEGDLTLCKDTALKSSWSIETCAAWYHLTPKGVSDIISPSVVVRKRFALSDEHTLTASLKVEWLISTGKNPKGIAVVPEFKLVHSWGLTNFLTLNHGPLLVPDHGVFGNDPTVIGGYDADLSWKLSKNLTVQAPMMKFKAPMSKVNDGRRRSEVVVGTGLTFSFDF